MVIFNVLFLIVLCIWIIVMYYSPKINIVTSKNKYIVLLWYNKWYCSGECKRTYIKLFEV